MTGADELAQARAARWWAGRPQITTAAKATTFVDDVGFALLFARRNLPAPNLWDLARDDPPHAEGWGPDIARVWKWKDDLPKRGKAWYGDFLFGAKCFLSPALVTLLYPRAGTADDFRDAGLSPNAVAVAEVVLGSGPTGSALLREAAGLGGKENKAAYSRALTELGRALVVTHYGIEEAGNSSRSGWPSAVIELTARAFAVTTTTSLEERRLTATARFVDTMVEAHPKELSKAFGWPLADARRHLDELVERGEAAAIGMSYVASTQRARRPIPKK